MQNNLDTFSQCNSIAWLDAYMCSYMGPCINSKQCGKKLKFLSDGTKNIVPSCDFEDFLEDSLWSFLSWVPAQNLQLKTKLFSSFYVTFYRIRHASYKHVHDFRDEVGGGSSMILCFGGFGQAEAPVFSSIPGHHDEVQSLKRLTAKSVDVMWQPTLNK